MKDTEQETIERGRAWRAFLARDSSAHHVSFTAGYIAAQQAVAGERDVVELVIERAQQMRGCDMYVDDTWEWKDSREQFDTAIAELERLRRSKQEGSG